MREHPIAKRIPEIGDIHGDRRQDDYAWLRRRDDPEVIAYLHAENAYAEDALRPTEAFREALYREMLARIEEDDSTVPVRRGRHLYYSRTEKGKQYPIHCRKLLGPDAPEEVVLDVNRLGEGRAFVALGAFAVSDDGRLLAYTVDFTGFRDYTLRVKDLTSGELLEGSVERVSAVAWTAEPGTFFYVTEDHAKRPHRLWLRRLGGAGDALVYEERDELFRLHVERSRSLAYLFAVSASHTASEVRFLPAATPDAPWRIVAAREKEHEYEVDHGIDGGGDRLYVRTNGGGRRNFRLVTVPADDPRPERWEEVLPHRDDVMLEGVEVFAGHYVAQERQAGLVHLTVTRLDTGESHRVEFAEPAYEVTSEGNVEFSTPRYRFRYQSLVTPLSVFDYDVTSRERVLLKRTEVRGGYDPARYRSERLHATAPDGTRIAISLVCAKDAPRDGTGALLLAGYGAYGLSYPVTFSSHRVSLLERGVTVALAHVRGGGEGGKRWHDAGRMLQKRNTFADFIAAAEFLVAHGYTSADRLVIEGGSAGGLLVGAVLNTRPDLCRAAVLRVPFVDVISTMLDESLPLTVGEFEEWGNPKIREHYDYLKTYCPYTNLAARSYPAMLVRTSLHDSQVMYWEPAKYVAKLRALMPNGNPLLLKVNMGAGHGGASGRYDALRELALDYAFILDRLGLAPPAS